MAQNSRQVMHLSNKKSFMLQRQLNRKKNQYLVSDSIVVATFRLAEDF